MDRILTHLPRTATEPRRSLAPLDVSPHRHLGVSRCGTASRSLGSGSWGARVAAGDPGRA